MCGAIKLLKMLVFPLLNTWIFKR